MSTSQMLQISMNLIMRIMTWVLLLEEDAGYLQNDLTPCGSWVSGWVKYCCCIDQALEMLIIIMMTGIGVTIQDTKDLPGFAIVLVSSFGFYMEIDHLYSLYFMHFLCLNVHITIIVLDWSVVCTLK